MPRAFPDSPARLVLALACLACPVLAGCEGGDPAGGGAGSPEALVLAFAEAYGDRDAAGIARLTHYVADVRGSVQEKRARDMARWRERFATHALDDCRVARLTDEDEVRIQPRERGGRTSEPSLRPLRKLVLEFTPRMEGAAARHGTRYIGKHRGRFYIVSSRTSEGD